VIAAAKLNGMAAVIAAILEGNEKNILEAKAKTMNADRS